MIGDVVHDGTQPHQVFRTMSSQCSTANALSPTVSPSMLLSTKPLTHEGSNLSKPYHIRPGGNECRLPDVGHVEYHIIIFILILVKETKHLHPILHG